MPTEQACLIAAYISTYKVFEICVAKAENLQDIEKWVIFLRDSKNKKKRDLLNAIMRSDEGIRKAGEILMTISEDEKEWIRQESRLKAELDYQSGILASREEGHTAGLAEGLAEGRQEGRTAGLNDAARGMKAENIPLDTIVKITGLSPEQVEAL